MRIFVLLASLLLVNEINPVFIPITQSGYYLYGDNITYSPTVANDAVIQISASNVTVDLGGSFYITQDNLVAGLSGIIVGSGLSNITIKNGIITNLTGTGIVIGQGCSNVNVQNILTFSCDINGMAFAGATSPNQIIDSSITNCKIRSCSQGATSSGAGLILQQCARTQVNTLIIDSNGDTTSTFTGILMNSCTDCDLSNVSIFSNLGNFFVGMELISPVNCSFTNCTVRDNKAETKTCLGMDINGASTFNLFTSCYVSTNSALAESCNGFNLQSGTTNNIFMQCQSNQNTGAGANGYNLSTATQNSFIDCIATGNTAFGAGNNCNGIFTTSSTLGVFLRFLSSHNSSVAATGAGMTITSSNNSAFQDCQFIGNTGSTAATSFGINETAGSTILYTRTIAFNNNTTAANQLNGLPAGSISTPTAPASSNLSTITAPWTNMSISQ